MERAIKKEKVINKIPPKVKNYQPEFYYCGECNKVYWKGDHYTKMKLLIENIKATFIQNANFP